MTETEKITGRLKEALGVKSDGQIANYLNISRQNIGAAVEMPAEIYSSKNKLSEHD